MEMKGEARIPAPQSIVWEALNDPEALKESITGCEELVREGDNAFSAKVRAKVGPVSARFSGRVSLTDIDAPNSYRIEGEGAGGAAGFAKGGAHVRLEPDGEDTTVLHYDVDANVGGKLAQIGSRLVDGAAKRMANDFFEKFSAVAAARAAASTPQPEATPEGPKDDAAVEDAPRPTPPVSEPPEQVNSAAESQVAEDAAAEGTRPMPRPQTGGAPVLMWIAGIGFVIAALIYVLF